MLENNYYSIDPTYKKQTLIDLQYWIMHDIMMRYSKPDSNETQIMLDRLKVSGQWPMEWIDKLFVEAWNKTSGAFLKQHGIDPLLMTHRGLL